MCLLIIRGISRQRRTRLCSHRGLLMTSNLSLPELLNPESRALNLQKVPQHSRNPECEKIKRGHRTPKRKNIETRPQSPPKFQSSRREQVRLYPGPETPYPAKARRVQRDRRASQVLVRFKDRNQRSGLVCHPRLAAERSKRLWGFGV